MDFLKYKTFLKKEYPSAYEFLRERPWRPIFFSESLSLSPKIYKQMEETVQSLFKLKRQKNYQSWLWDKRDKSHFSLQAEKWLKSALHNHKQDSVLMAYDFHVQQKTAQLIEVNTNASSFLLFNSFRQFRGLPYEQALKDLKKSFQTEWEKFTRGQKGPAPRKTVLIDKDPLNQKMALEFFMFKDFFQSMNWPFEICDSRSLKADKEGFLYTPKGDKADFIYNRSTDFYFEDHPHLALACQKGSCAISPNPMEYFLLSDKNRLSDWSKKHWPELEKIKKNLPFSKILLPQNEEDIWKNRKKYFFKIRQGHGGQMAYRGSSLSKKKFKELIPLNSLIQEYIPPSKIKDSQGEEWKTDWRLYVYEDQIQQFCARCYQGQVTNFKKEGSGFAVVNLIK